MASAVTATAMGEGTSSSSVGVAWRWVSHPPFASWVESRYARPLSIACLALCQCSRLIGTSSGVAASRNSGGMGWMSLCGSGGGSYSVTFSGSIRRSSGRSGGS